MRTSRHQPAGPRDRVTACLFQATSQFPTPPRAGRGLAPGSGGGARGTVRRPAGGARGSAPPSARLLGKRTDRPGLRRRRTRGML
ncbi:hypothetical protein Y1Q_0017780 [Alligator mississippiensis]|uniref:Uncharacterized protein n=1 Tax=Alligator mississippiensis TaxID=8496 RepID=A0A151MJN3_ALLMI|nr:hypothetical protein Y1Q_0017780 [Alligator mississippiensis]